tara:strand:+ start:1227 stop:2816 length:1590 start_codon:yes stop_codon:yes gene_type:complete
MRFPSIVTYYLLSVFLSAFIYAESISELESLKKIIANLENENAELKTRLVQSNAKIETQKISLSEKESKIVALKENDRKSREAQRLDSGSSIGRNRGPKGDIILGSLTLGGAIRANLVSGDYDNLAADGNVRGPSRDDGSASLGTLIFNGTYDFGDFSAFAEYRFYDSIGSYGGSHFLHTFYLGKEYNDGSDFKLGIVEVPFGIERFGAAYGYLNHLDYVVGLSDDRDLGLTYSFALSDWDLDLGYFWGAEPKGKGQSKNSARGSFDVVSPLGSSSNPSWPYTAFIGEGNNFLEGNFSPWEEGRQFNIRVKKQLYSGGFENTIGASYQYGKLESTDTLGRFDPGKMNASSLFIKSTYGSWQMKAALMHYDYAIDTLKDGENYLRYNPDQIVVGIFDTPLFVASEGVIPSLGISYTIFPRNLSFIDYLVPYLDYSRIIKNGHTDGPSGYYYLQPENTEFRDSEQLSLGTMIGIGQLLIYVDYAMGKGSPLIGNNNDQYFTGASVNHPFSPSTNFDLGWQSRLTINFGYYF